MAPENLDTLAAVYAELGEFQQAAATIEKAIKYLQNQTRSNDIETFQNILRSYKKNQIYHLEN